MNQERFEDLNCFDGSEAFAATSTCRHERHRACCWSMSRPFEYDKKRSCAYQQNVSTAKRGLRDRESLVDEKKTMYIEGTCSSPPMNFASLGGLLQSGKKGGPETWLHGIYVHIYIHTYRFQSFRFVEDWNLNFPPPSPLPW